MESLLGSSRLLNNSSHGQIVDTLGVKSGLGQQTLQGESAQIDGKVIIVNGT